MDQLRRHILNAFRLLSFILFLVTLILWIRSTSAADMAGWYPEAGVERQICSSRGQFQFYEIHWIGDDPPGTPDGQSSPPAYRRRERFPSSDFPPGMFKWWDFTWQTGDDTEREISLAGLTWLAHSASPDAPHFYAPLFIAIPHWLVAAVFALAPALSVRRAIRRRRSARAGRCRVCNYDLRATPARCPECGSAVGFEAAR